MNERIMSQRTRKKIRFTKPKEQIYFMLPTFIIFVLTALVSYLVITNLQDAAVQALYEQGANKEHLSEFAKTTNGYFGFFGIAVAALAVVGFYWTWNLSFKMFGPIPRLERELAAIRDGIMDPAGLRIRKKDMLHTTVELFRDLLLKKTSADDGGTKTAETEKTSS